MSELEALIASWRRDADVLEGNLDTRGAALLRAHAAQVEQALRRAGDDLLTLAGAAELSGYSQDHIRHLVADGTIPNAGRKGSPRIRRRDLPVKPGSRVDPRDARALAESMLRSVA